MIHLLIILLDSREVTLISYINALGICFPWWESFLLAKLKWLLTHSLTQCKWSSPLSWDYWLRSPHFSHQGNRASLSLIVGIFTICCIEAYKSQRKTYFPPATAPLFLPSVTCHSSSQCFFPICQLLIRTKSFPGHLCSKKSVFRIYSVKICFFHLIKLSFPYLRKRPSTLATEHVPIPSESFLASADCLQILAAMKQLPWDRQHLCTTVAFLLLRRILSWAVAFPHVMHRSSSILYGTVWH